MEINITTQNAKDLEAYIKYATGDISDATDPNVLKNSVGPTIAKLFSYMSLQDKETLDYFMNQTNLFLEDGSIKDYVKEHHNTLEIMLDAYKKNKL